MRNFSLSILLLLLTVITAPAPPVPVILPGTAGQQVVYIGGTVVGPGSGTAATNVILSGQVTKAAGATTTVINPKSIGSTNLALQSVDATNIVNNTITSNQLASTTIDLSNFTPSATNWLFLVASNYAWTLSQNGTNETTRKTQIVNTNVPANYGLFGPRSGGAALPFFRFMVPADMGTNVLLSASTGITITPTINGDSSITYAISATGAGGSATNAIGNNGGFGTNWINFYNTSGILIAAFSNGVIQFNTNIVLAAGVGITNASGGSWTFTPGTNIFQALNGGGNSAFNVTSNGILVAGTNFQMVLDTTGNLTIKGQFNGSGAGLTAGTVPVAALANTGTAGTYRSTTFNAEGVETGGSNPTTFAGYGLSDSSANFKLALTDYNGWWWTNLNFNTALSNVTSHSYLGNSGASAGYASAILTLDTSLVPAWTGDVTGPGGSLALTIAAGAVTLSKMANETANTVLGNGTGSPAAPQALTLLPAVNGGLLTSLSGQSLTGQVAFAQWDASAFMTNGVQNSNNVAYVVPSAGSGGLQGSSPLYFLLPLSSISTAAGTNQWLEQLYLPPSWNSNAVNLSVEVFAATNLPTTATSMVFSASISWNGSALATPITVTNNIPVSTGFISTNIELGPFPVTGTAIPNEPLLIQWQYWSVGNGRITNNSWVAGTRCYYTNGPVQNGIVTGW